MDSKMWPMQPVECYSATGENEVLTHATTRMSPGNIVLNQRSQTHRSRIVCGSIYRKMSSTGESVEIEGTSVVARGCRVARNGERLPHVFRVSFWGDEMI